MTPAPDTPTPLAEQILAHAAGHAVQPGDVVTAPLDLVMIHDSIAPSVLTIMRDELGVTAPWDRDRVALAIDHVSPASTVVVAENQRMLRDWARDLSALQPSHRDTAGLYRRLRTGFDRARLARLAAGRGFDPPAPPASLWRAWRIARGR